MQYYSLRKMQAPSKLYALIVSGHSCDIESDPYAVSADPMNLFTAFLKLCTQHTPCECILQMNIIELEIPVEASPQELAREICIYFKCPFELKPVELDILYEEGISNHYKPYAKRCLNCGIYVNKLDSPCTACGCRPGQWEVVKLDFWHDDNTQCLPFPKDVIQQGAAENCLPHYIPLENGRMIYL